MTAPAKNGKPNQFRMLGSDSQGIDEVNVRTLPMMTDAQRRETLDRIEALGLFDPPYAIDDPQYYLALLKGVDVTLNSGISNAESYAENRIKPFSIEGLRNYANDVRRIGAERAMEMLQSPPESIAPGGVPGQEQMPMMGVGQPPIQ
jgi:hypothetical protein